ncbi:hypothetical protein AMECASPLE_014563, partial [Ameca splendens]
PCCHRVELSFFLLSPFSSYHIPLRQPKTASSCLFCQLPSSKLGAAVQTVSCPQRKSAARSWIQSSITAAPLIP